MPDDLSNKWLNSTPTLTWKERWRKLWEAGGTPRVTLWLWNLLCRAFFTGERAEKMQVANEPCCRSKTTSKTISHLFYECRKSQSRWQLLRANARASHASFCASHGLLELIDEAIKAKKDGGAFVFIFYSLTSAIWKDRNATFFRNKQQETPLLISLEATRAELEGSLNKVAFATRWQRSQKAMKELNQLIAYTKKEPPQRTRDPSTSNGILQHLITTGAQDQPLQSGSMRDSALTNGENNSPEVTAMNSRFNAGRTSS
ncbi:hypothetical protein R1flu_000819 [Riccia fluitans]|uniref:Reverse transcriptase zinc-binding domain-containing protein n=1 Tax=Riccia fluitans TaxID=41844 RepID=A0ABD1Y5L8_9MARC